MIISRAKPIKLAGKSYSSSISSNINSTRVRGNDGIMIYMGRCKKFSEKSAPEPILLHEPHMKSLATESEASW
jgi:hypothetical protein